MTAIMQFGDYISSKTVQELTPDQYQKFREYLRVHGFSVDDELGTYEKASMDSCEFVHLDLWGDLVFLVWRSTISSGREITANEILDAIQSMKSLTTSKYFVMRIHNSIPIVNCDAQSHATEELARAAAEKLAKENPTQKFCVLKYCGEVQACGVEWN